MSWRSWITQDDGGLEENMEVADSGNVDYIEKSIEAPDTDDFQNPIDKDEGKDPSAPDSLSERKTDQICLNKEKHEENVHVARKCSRM